MKTRWRGGWLLIAWLLSAPAWAQDAHYWTRQFGNRAWLLGGALLGDPADISAVYYNPGALVLVGSLELELTGNVFEYSRLALVNGLGLGRDLTTSRFDALPAFIAGPLPFKWLGRARMGYALLSRQGFETLLTRRDDFSGADLLGVQGLEQLSSDVRLEHGVKELWAGVSWAYPLSKTLGVGITPFLAARQQHANFLAISQGSGADGSSVLATVSRDYRVQHLRLLAKVGVSYQRERWALGLTVTTPGLGLLGKGEVGLERALSQQGFSFQGPERISNFQSSVRARFQSPLSVGFGGNVVLGGTTVHAAMEVFTRVPIFRLLDSDPIPVSGPERVLGSDVFYGSEPLVNAALGAEHRVGDRLRVFLSVHTDFSAAINLPNTSTLLATSDLYHVATGLHFPVRTSRVTVGTDLAWGRQSTQRFSDLLSQTGLPPPSETQRVHVFHATLIVGITLGLGRNTDETSTRPDSDLEVP
ncbi:hypothetical protein LXT21_34370 [Myxococcus sp. K38C18041901]|uniref:hypothetical protein n=1 Tax=Myxococcus guangdongensis TaxID=2906760 RepID=UPI0020A7DEF9|nr:hypothetical protein [Myxococcus guangdongensis]MCP3063874.1 hypothetical protein [Myxococcus guangdongensis]